MATVTLKMPAGGLAAERPARKSLFARLYDGMIEAQMRRARRELAQYGYQWPADDEANAAVRFAREDLPFKRR